MSHCCVPGCRVRRKAGKPVYMARFPSNKVNPRLRQQWIANISKYCPREAWQPNVAAVVCEMHFTKDMWEKERTDGTRKLRRNEAVPTLFFGLEGQNIRNKYQKVRNKIQQWEENGETIDLGENVEIVVEIGTQSAVEENPALSTSDTADVPTKIDDTNKMFENEMSSFEESPASSSDTANVPTKIDETNKMFENEIAQLKRQLSEANEKVQIANEMLAKNARQKRQWKDTYERQRKTILKLTNQQSQIKSAFKQMLNDDQIEALVKKARGVRWSNATIQKSLKLKFACGSAGYDELRAQNVPLPSSRTLRRALQGIDLKVISQWASELSDNSVAQIDDDRGRDSVLVIDEMALKPSRDSDSDPLTETYCEESSFTTSKGASGADGTL